MNTIDNLQNNKPRRRIFNEKLQCVWMTIYWTSNFIILYVRLLLFWLLIYFRNRKRNILDFQSIYHSKNDVRQFHFSLFYFPKKKRFPIFCFFFLFLFCSFLLISELQLSQYRWYVTASVTGVTHSSVKNEEVFLAEIFSSHWQKVKEIWKEVNILLKI